MARPVAVDRNPLLTRTEAAAYLKIKPSTLASWACAGRYGLPLVRVGGAVRYRRADLDRWLDGRTVREGARP